MNKNLSQFAKQLAAIWQQLGLNQRISVLMATITLVVGLGALAFWSSRPDYALLYGKLDEGEAAKVIAALDESKVPYQIGRGGGSILVPSDKVYQLRMQMAGKGIPRGEGVGYEIFDKASFGVSDFVQRANYARAIQGELARTISQLDQVESARVMIVMPENRLLSDSLRKPTASVFVRVRGNGAVAHVRGQFHSFSRRQQCRRPPGQQRFRGGQPGQRPLRESGERFRRRFVRQPAYRPAQL